MSYSLYWRPVVPRKGKYLDDALKFVLRKKFGDGCAIAPGTVLGSDDIPYLEGLRDADVKGAEDLIDAIEQYGSVELYTE